MIILLIAISTFHFISESLTVIEGVEDSWSIYDVQEQNGILLTIENYIL
jgi:hypothetical protein